MNQNLKNQGPFVRISNVDVSADHDHIQLTDIFEKCFNYRSPNDRNRRHSDVSTTSSSHKKNVKKGLAYLASRQSSSELTSEGRKNSNLLELPDEIPRLRINSLPENYNCTQTDEQLYKLRTFSIAKGNVINCGDSLVNRSTKSNNSLHSSITSRSENLSSERLDFLTCCLPLSDTEDELDIFDQKCYKILLLGSSGIGKTSLVNQFMTSEYINTYDASLDEDNFEKTVSVVLDNVESHLTFIDHHYYDISVENALSTNKPNACIVVYAIISKSSFRIAKDILNYLCEQDFCSKNAVILVANKCDLEKARVICAKEGRMVATNMNCKFTETSSFLKYNVDELLVGILKQIRLKEVLHGGGDRRRKSITSTVVTSSSELHMKSINLGRNLFSKKYQKSKSCQNLLVP